MTWFARDFMRWLAGNRGRLNRVVRPVPDHRIWCGPTIENTVTQLIPMRAQPNRITWRQGYGSVRPVPGRQGGSATDRRSISQWTHAFEHSSFVHRVLELGESTMTVNSVKIAG